MNHVPKVGTGYFFPRRHADFFCDAERGQILGADDRDQAGYWKAGESEVAAGAGGLGSQALSPEIAADVVADLDFVCAIYILNRQATIADEFAVCFRDYCPETVAVLGAAATVAGDPLFDAGLV